MDLTPVFVLHTRPFRNTSLLVDFFSEKHGRISAVARSARGPKSRYRGQLQLFTPMLISWSGRGELKTLNQLELQGMPFQLHDQALFCGFYLNELLMRLLQKEDAHPKLYVCYQETLAELQVAKNIAVALRLFEKRLLELLGYGLSFQREASSGEDIIPEYYYAFHPQQGFIIADQQSHEVVFSGKHLLKIATEQLDTDDVLLTAKRLMRMALAPLLGDKPLHSRSLF